MEPNYSDPNEPILNQENEEIIRGNQESSRESPHNEHNLPVLSEPNENHVGGSENYFVLENVQKKTIDDGITLIVEYIMQEKICPNIMPYQEKLMAYLKEKIENQDIDIQSMTENKSLEDKKKKFILDLKALEVESSKYLIKNYLRIRMIKIQKYCDCIFKLDLFRFLSSNEEKFVREYHTLRLDYLNKNCLNKLPSEFRNIGLNAKEDKFENLSVLYPNFSKFVFIKVKKTMNRVSLSGANMEIDFIKDDIYILEYKHIKTIHDFGGVELL